MRSRAEAVQYAMSRPPKVTDTHIFFFDNDTNSDLDCLSQWFEAPFSGSEQKPGQQDFHTTEHYMMYRKAKLMDDAASMDAIHKARTPHEAKSLGRKITSYNGELWHENCDRIVERGNYLKFSQNPSLAQLFIGTSERVLVEGNPEDRIWGVGFNNEDAQGHENEWGENKLDMALMRARS